MKFLVLFPLIVSILAGANAGGIFCKECQLFAKKAEQVLNNLANGQEGNIEHVIDSLLCDRFPVGKQTCKNLVHKYLQDIINYVESHEGNINLCALIHLCPNKMDEDLPMVEEPVIEANGGFLCNLCKTEVKDAEDALNSLVNADEKKVQNIIDTKLCAKLGPFQGLCKTLVKQNLQAIVNYINQEEGQLDLCAMIHLCKSSMKMDVDPAGGILCGPCQAFMKEALAEIKQNLNANEPTIEQILNNLVCGRLGPLRGYCTNEVHALLPKIIQAIENQASSINLCQIIKLCESSMIEEEVETVETIDESGGLLCTECQALVKDLEKKINSLINADEGQIEQIIDQQVCSRLGPLAGYCKKLVHKYLPMIVQQIKNGEQLNICQIIGICRQALEEDVAVVSGQGSSIFCKQCQTLVANAEQKLNNLLNADEGQIEQIIDNEVCRNLGALAGVCRGLVKKYLPVLVKDVENGEAKLHICQLIKLCNGPSIDFQQRGLLCGLCQRTWNSVEKKIKQDLQKEENPLDVKLDNLCKRVPLFKKPCEKEAALLVNDVVQWLDNKLDHLPFCKDIKICK